MFKRVAIIEDEPLIAMLLEDYLSELGRDVAGSASSVDDALSLVATGGFDVAILDVHLREGRRSGPVADALRDAGIPFVLATGGADDLGAPEWRDCPVLPKPFTLANLESSLAQLYDMNA